MNKDLKRALALKQFLNEDFFVVNDTAYEGTLEDAQASFVENGESDDTFEDYVHENYIMVEEISGDEFNCDYLVLTDAEADDKWEEALDSYLDDCVYPSLPKHLSGYFDDEAWKRDARMDGRGHSLATYDGHEHYETIDGEEFYIYRIN
jgi:hypothetical protein